MGIDYVLGMICGILVVCLIYFIFLFCVKKIYKKDKNIKPEYDERQILARYKAYKVGFISLIIVILLNSFIYENVSQWCTITILSSISIMISLFIFITVCIFNDAYWKNYENKKLALTLITVSGIINLIPAFIDYSQNKTFLNSDGKFDNLNLVAAIMVFCVEVIILIKKIITKKYGDMDEES